VNFGFREMNLKSFNISPGSLFVGGGPNKKLGRGMRLLLVQTPCALRTQNLRYDGSVPTFDPTNFHVVICIVQDDVCIGAAIAKRVD
jgi:hypothetical protein